VQEIVKQFGRARGASGHLQGPRVFEADGRQRGHARLTDGVDARRDGGQVGRKGRDGVGLDVEGLELLEPGVLVGRVDAVGGVVACQHLVALEHDMVFRGEEGGTDVAQRSPHAGVTVLGRGFVVVVGVDRLHAQQGRQFWNFLARVAVSHDQPACGTAGGRGRQIGQGMLQAQLFEGGVELDHAVADERHAPVGTGQRVQDGGVEHKNTPDASGIFQGVVKRGVIGDTQVAAEPDQGGIKGAVVHLCAVEAGRLKLEACLKTLLPPSI
jgi:hypothetical protein